MSSQIHQNYFTELEIAINHLVNRYLGPPTPPYLWASISTQGCGSGGRGPLSSVGPGEAQGLPASSEDAKPGCTEACPKMSGAEPWSHGSPHGPGEKPVALLDLRALDSTCIDPALPPPTAVTSWRATSWMRR